MKKTALITLGRLPKGLDVARALTAAGWRVIVAEPFPWHLMRASRAVEASFQVAAPNDDLDQYLDDLLRIIREQDVSLIVPISEEILPVVQLHDRLPESVRLFCPEPEEIHRVHDKLAFSRLAREFGLPVPDTADASEEAAGKIAQGGRFVVKPALSCSGIGVEIRDAGALEEVRPGDIVQAFLPGEHLSTFAIAHNGRVLFNVTYRGTIFSGTVAVAFQRVDDATDVDEWVAAFAEKARWNGFLSFDFIRDEAGRALAIECNPRVTSGVHFVSAAGLASAILSPEDCDDVQFKDATELQQFWPCLTEVQGSAFSGVGPGSTFRRYAQVLTQAKDVTWMANDPLPLLTMPLTSYPILRRTIFNGESFGEASTRDIALFSERAPAPGSAGAAGS